ncbi:cytochrome P450 [Laetiporus sulphureus 93-53]|uniref:Cytochrome P450 n=1 Tax=Laetiporus sulphureus 93-53 TaxID=1314785 RepID=A0A165EMR1_9APHY|nr:cytochrome P450 [Laetiporus sulphureus 93-53]KZT07386.1 cytochrome P450 [Laetiporus sulphureus 93-53]
MDTILPAAAALCLAAVAKDILRPLAVAAIAGGTYVLAKHLMCSRKRLRLAPGPIRWPLVGNVLQIPQLNPWLTYSKWADTYGDIIHLDVLGRPVIIINSAEVARDLLDKRSSVYSDRPHLVMACDLVGYSETFALKPYGEEFRRQRKLVRQDFAQGTVLCYYHLQETEAHKLVQAVLQDPSSLAGQVKMRISAIIMEASYGYTVKSEDDPYITIPFTSMANFSKACAVGTWLVDFIPQLQYLPHWMPGAGFLRTAREWRETHMNASWNPYRWCKQNISSGIAHTPSLCATSLLQADGGLSQENEHTLVWAAASVLGGGLDTNMSTILTFFLAMLHYPDVQAKAQAEIDAVVGTDRLPSITDRASLPYVRSLVTEVYRWNPAVPLCLPHALSEADVYNGIHLPKGSVVMPNVWHMLHDPTTYADPMDFKPERYGNSDAEMQKVTDLAFGFGRRACPGFYFAQGTIFAVIATVLATCDVVPAVDEHGAPVIPEVAYTSGTIVFPEPFRCNVKSRTERARALLAQSIPPSE